MAQSSVLLSEAAPEAKLLERVFARLWDKVRELGAERLIANRRDSNFIDFFVKEQSSRVLIARFVEHPDHLVVLAYIAAEDGFVHVINEAAMERETDSLFSKISLKLCPN